MSNDRTLYKLVIFSVVSLLLVVGVLPVMMQDATATPTNTERYPQIFEIEGRLESITEDEIVVDGVTIKTTTLALNPSFAVGDAVEVRGAITEGVFNAYRVRWDDDDDNDRDDDNFELLGVIEAVEGDFIVVAGQQVQLVNTEIEVNLVVGQFVKIDGLIINGVFTADEIERPDRDDRFNDWLDDFLDDLDDLDGLVIPADCVVSAPEGWVQYTIRSGDAISSIAQRSGGYVAELARINCMNNPRFIVAGATIYVPYPPASGRRGNRDEGSFSSRDWDRGDERSWSDSRSNSSSDSRSDSDS